MKLTTLHSPRGHLSVSKLRATGIRGIDASFLNARAVVCPTAFHEEEVERWVKEFGGVRHRLDRQACTLVA